MLEAVGSTTGSVVLPVKALVPEHAAVAGGVPVPRSGSSCDGHPAAAVHAHRDTSSPPTCRCCCSEVAPGLSMDYEGSSFHRIREFRLELTANAQDNDESVAISGGPTGCVITAAALIMAITSALTPRSRRCAFGVGLTLAVLVDATLVRLVLVPAFMRTWRATGTGGAGCVNCTGSSGISESASASYWVNARDHPPPCGRTCLTGLCWNSLRQRN